MDNISTGLKWAIGVILTMFIISAGINVYFVANGYFDKAQEQTVSQSQVLNQAEYNIYDNKDVAGQEVINASTRFSGRPQFAIHIKTGVNKTGFYAENNYKTCFEVPENTTNGKGIVNVSSNSCSNDSQVSVQQMRDVRSSNNYVNPNGIFTANIYYDANDEVRLIEFEQK
ncbi:hypothetical protein BK126_26360 [Paenibacillus sp. FSL H7-0326]|uniref:hypothetical protein n=1 Tax=Paenibacillus sp. FSL H7-0326 TaxID=1921144 RepID=UPI00096C9082|nr:hypothetical protein [Paenibacillus sp. FSL H7-0326]OMC63719.1 hypothetical protein BK126_26360 [Paenibacillus sp. FSL H7-0326]